jgi:hypothetical protein
MTVHTLPAFSADYSLMMLIQNPGPSVSMSLIVPPTEPETARGSRHMLAIFMR